MQQSIRRIDPLSAMKIAAVIYGILGLVIGAIFSLIGSLGFIAAAGTPGMPRILTLLFGVAAIIIVPAAYAIMGAIGALIMTAVYNLVAGVTGGLRIDLE